MSRVIHFDISAVQSDRAIQFYRDTFGWKFNPMEGMDYWTIETGPDTKEGINGGMVMRQKDNYVVNTIQVDNIDQAVAKVKANGGKILEEKQEIPGYGSYAQFEDTEGNIFGLIQFFSK